MSELIHALENERVALEAALAADARFQKLQRIRELLSLYAATVDPLPLSRPIQETNGATRPRRQSTKTIAMEREITELLREKVQLHRSMILDYLNAKGIMGGEKNQMAHLASFLSDHRHLYTADGRGNFRLAEQGAHESEPESGQPFSEPAGPDGNVT
jgi:hypothetical protein